MDLSNKELKFSCFYCQNNAESKNIPFTPYDTIDDLKVHFTSKHSSERRLFYALGAVACFYCEKVDIYGRLRNHQNFRHNGKLFICVDQFNRSNCGFCHRSFPPDEMEKHFRTEHDLAFLIGVFSPICFQQNEVEQLLNLSSCDSSKCPSEIQKFICGHCNMDLEATKTSLKNHFESATFVFQCSKCEFVINNFENLVEHELSHHSIDARAKHMNDLKIRLKKYYNRTRTIFTNGLVMFQQNMVSTSFDFRKEFWSFIDDFVEIKFGHRKVVNETKLKCIEPMYPCVSSKTTFKEDELKRQRAYRNNLCISGIFHVQKEELRRIFLNICDAIEVHVSMDDIESIFQRSEYDIIVKLDKWDTKKEILLKWNAINATEFSNKLRSISFLHQRLQHSNLTIENDLTPFFKALWNAAEIAKMKKHIYKYWISWWGLTVKFTPTSEPTVVWSNLDLSAKEK